MIKIITKLCLALSLGIIPAIWIAQNNKHIKSVAITPILQLLEKKWNARVTVKQVHANLFTGVISLKHLKIKSKHPVTCTWKCSHGKLYIQKRSSLYDKRVNLHVELNDNSITTDYKEGTLGVAQLLQNIFGFQSEQFNAQSFFINNIDLKMTDTSQPSININGSLRLKKDNNNLWHGRFCPDDLSVSTDKKQFVTNFSGITRFNQSQPSQESHSSKPFSLKTKHTCYLPFLQQPCTISGQWGSSLQEILIKNEQETLSCKLTSTIDGLVASLDIKHPRGISIAGTVTWNPQKKHPGTYNLRLATDYTEHPIPLSGTFFLQAPYIITSGTCPYAHYFVSLDLQEDNPVTKIVLQKNGTISARFTQDRDKKLSGTIDYKFLQTLFPVALRKYLIGNRGTFHVKIDTITQDNITGTISLTDGKLHIPGNYNLIKEFTGTFSCCPQQQKLLLHDISLGLYKGSISCDQATLYWDNNRSISFLHAHLSLNNLLVNWQDDIFSFVDGILVITKKGDTKPTNVFGDIIIKKSLVKESIFSGKAGSDILQSSVLPLIEKDQSVFFDINISNEQDITIKMPFLQTQATADIHTTMHTTPHGLSPPHIHGNITLRRGTLTFPKNKLFISSGKINFIPTQINNPMVNLLAKNRIKKYLISLNVSGPLQQPTIFLESNPQLEEEQIIALLFAGSEAINLKANLPVILMQNLHKLIFGEKKSLPPAQQFFKTLTTPLKYIQITPNFTDQSGRGGVTGTISVDINKQLHAHIQKNFTMQDDLAFQLEYFLSDDVNVKAIKDARGDIGAEIELVYKP